MNDEEKLQAQGLAMCMSLNRDNIYYGAKQQEEGLRRQMWNDIQQLKRDIGTLKSAIDHIQEFLNGVYGE